ncbi:hypothetical protein D3C79_897240 [compost metagenome]
MNDVMKVLKDDAIKILNQQFDNACSIEFELKKSEVNRLIGKLEGLKAGIHYLRTV